MNLSSQISEPVLSQGCHLSISRVPVSPGGKQEIRRSSPRLCNKSVKNEFFTIRAFSLGAWFLSPGTLPILDLAIRRGVDRPVHFGVSSRISDLYSLDARSTPPLTCDSHKRLQTLLRVPWEEGGDKTCPPPPPLRTTVLEVAKMCSGLTRFSKWHY